MFELSFTNQFKKDLKLLKKRSPENFNTLNQFIKQLAVSGFSSIDKKYKPHYLKGNYRDYCECHVLNDLLLIWKEDKLDDTIVLVRTGTHSDLF